MAASTHIAEAEDADLDGILEADTSDDNQVLELESAPEPRPVAPPPPTGTSKFPWQPASKMAEPMASALRRAAEEAARAESPEAPAAQSIGFHAALSTPSASASAPAPAREKTQIMLPPPPAALSEAPAAEVREPLPFEKLANTPRTPVEEEAPMPPTFFPGAYDQDEVEGGKTKAIVIIAVVALLACSAGYLSWKNMGSKSEANTPAASTASAATGAKAQDGTTGTQPTVTDITIGGDTAAVPTKPTAAKPALKESSAAPRESAPATKQSILAEEDTEPEVTQRIIVKNDTRHLVPPPPAAEQETVQAPNAMELSGAGDSKVPNIASGPVNVPKPAQVVRVSQGVMEGLLVKRVQPRYPAQAMQMRIQGSVEMQATISKTGDITNLKVVSGDGLLSRAAQEAVKQWKYKPYYLNGDPVEIQTQILVNFKLPN